MTIDQEMTAFVRTSELPFVLTRLSDFTIEAASAAYFEQVAIAPSEVLGASVFSLMDESEQPRAREALQALADGTVDFYRTYRPLRATRTHRAGVYVWSHAIDFGHERYALTQILAVNAATESPLEKSLGYEPVQFAIGIMDEHGVVTTVSNDLERITGARADDLIGRQLLAPEQHGIWSHFHGTHPERNGCALSLPYSSTGRTSLAAPIQCLLVCLAGSRSICFILSKDPAGADRGSAERVNELEEHLRRIAHEVAASGVIATMPSLPDPTRFPQLRALNSRQWDVLTRLLRGDRVATIAQDLFLSQSAVRNHLSEIFRRFDVHSQSELLALLRP